MERSGSSVLLKLKNMRQTAIQNNILKYQVDNDGIARITIHMTEQPTNLFSLEFVEAYVEAAKQALQDQQVKGVIVTSAHRDFMAGADLKFIGNPPEDRKELFDGLLQMHREMREIEKGGKPFVAAINGNALGGGYELALTCHHRIALNNPKIKIGLPETQLGLFPGGGGTQRLPYLIGIQNALTIILQGQQLRPQKALSQGLVDALVEDEEELLASAKKWILEKGNSTQPWDNRKHKIPGGALMSPGGAQTMIAAIGNVRKKTHGNYPGVTYALSAVHDGMQLPIDRGLEVEARYFIKAFYSPEAQNLIRTGFFAINEAKKGKAKPEGYPTFVIKKLGILGAGMMGAGIAYVSARAGMNVVLKDISTENAEHGKGYSEKLLQKRVSRGRMTGEAKQEVLDRIHPTETASDLEGCDLIIEAVFENPELKAKVTQEAEAFLAEDKIFASNTSTLPITRLAKASKRPANFIGIHFFSPVDKMPLVEIIVGKETDDRTIAAAVDYVTAINKIPIVVNDSQGFFTSRVFGTFTGEGALMLQEGVPAPMIENVAKRVGMPVGPLAVTDEVSLTLAVHVMENMPDMPEHTQRMYDLYQKMIGMGREGKKAKKGFYEYPENDKKYLWPELNKLFGSDVDTLDGDTVGKRLLHIMALESYRCLEEGVLRNTTDGDIGSLAGFGFPPYTGGVFSYIDYVGPLTFIAECDAFAERFGERFRVPDSLRQKAEQGELFYAKKSIT